MRQLLLQVQTLLVAALAAAGQTNVVSTVIDTQGLDSVTLEAHLGAVTAGGVGTFKVQGGGLADGSDAADIEGATLNFTDADANKFLAIEIHRPETRYLKATVTRATQNSVVNGIFAFLYGASHVPVDQPQLARSIALVTPPLA